jgi:hypothetical protein
MWSLRQNLLLKTNKCKDLLKLKLEEPSWIVYNSEFIQSLEDRNNLLIKENKIYQNLSKELFEFLSKCH